jgi:hypothetical protein
MTSKQLASLVSESIALEQEIADAELLLRANKDRLIEEAKVLLREESDIAEALHSGASYTFKNEHGAVARVSFPKRGLLRGFWLHDGAAFKKRGDETIELKGLVTLAGEWFDKLFAKRFVPAKAFRELAPTVLSPAKAEKLVELCLEDSSPRVSFEVKEAN